MAAGEEAVSLAADMKVLSLLSTDATAGLSSWAALGFTLLGAAFGGILMFLSFRVTKWMTESPQDCDSESGMAVNEQDKREPLLPNTSDSEGSTACSGGSWYVEPGRATSAPKAEGAMSWSMLIFTVLISLPSMLGTWCWPLLLPMLMPALGGSVESDSNREAAHHFTFGADVALFGTVIVYVGRTAFESKLSHWASRWGPLLFVSLGCTLIVLDPIRHVLLDHGGVFFKEMDLAMYSSKGGLSTIGMLCQYFSIGGIVLLLSGVLWHMKVPEAILSKCCGEDCKTL